MMNMNCFLGQFNEKKVNYKKLQRDLSRVSGKLTVYPIKFSAKAMPVLKTLIYTVTDAKTIITTQKKNRSSNFHSLLYENISHVLRIVSKENQELAIYTVYLDTPPATTHIYGISSVLHHLIY